MIGRDDGCHDVAAESRTSLKQTVGFGVNIKSGAVCGKTGVEPCGKARTDIAADICCTDKQNSGSYYCRDAPEWELPPML